MHSRPVAPKRFSDADHPYSASRTAAGLIFVSGQLGVLDDDIVPGGIGAEARQALANLKACLAEHGRGPADVVKTTVLLADLAERGEFDAIYAEFFTEPRPARTCYAAGALPYGARVEVEAIASAGVPRGSSERVTW
ncbi:RidA family protein [Streptomyces sp. TS71-3]|uniref:RidA family protein n=1 Tax=Streptomyces sp. TS71-3 TaxID=2733862 RepID=UPI001B2550DC|nr:Rid family hydrolase [Streptomyces sp. TS71-3]GHJ39783.1 reactive intermediate/imine deaminase [Streptomyces sp. TS71-3]